jgi:hypothetical protein
LEQALADAGMSPGRRRHRRATSNRDREARADAELRRAGIEPGDPSLYPRTPADLQGRPDPAPPVR